MRIVGNEPHVIILTETIPKAQVVPISPALLAIPGYSCYLNFDCSAPNLGASGIRGICIYIQEKLKGTQVTFPNDTFQEQLWVQLRLKNSDYLLIGGIYRSPTRDAKASTEDM